MRLSYRQREAPCRQGDISAVMDAVCGDVYFHYDMGSRSGKIGDFGAKAPRKPMIISE